MAIPMRDNLSEAEFLAFESGAVGRHEFYGGRIVAMTGASKEHNEIAINVVFALRELAKLGGCRTFMEGVRLRIDEFTHVYPDVMVVCDEDRSDSHEVRRPCFVAEVLSPSTTWVDHGTKRAAYLGMDSLRHYLLINPVHKVIEHYERADATCAWTSSIVDVTATIALRCPAGPLVVADLFST